MSYRAFVHPQQFLLMNKGCIRNEYDKGLRKTETEIDLSTQFFYIFGMSR